MRHLKSLVFFLIICSLHLFFVIQSQIEIKHYFIPKTYGFLFLLYIVVLEIKRRFKEKILKWPYLALSLNIFKALLSLIYLLPLLSSPTQNTTSYIIHFFISYFIFLIKEIFNYKQQLNPKNNLQKE